MNAPHDQSQTQPPGPNLGFELPSARPIPRQRLTKILLIALVLVALAFVIGYLPGHTRRTALAAAASQATLPHVGVLVAKEAASDRALDLPGAVQPLQETTISARATGYVKAWKVDIGDKVKQGQILAEIETPELDQELAQARAQVLQTRASLEQAKANRDLAQANLNRATRLAPSGIVSKADLETAQAQSSVGGANVNVANANIAAQEANIRRLDQLKAFSHVTAPFAGTITQRNVEVGSLVTANNGSPLFRLAAMDPARVFVQVPQDVAPSIKPGVVAKVSVREYPGRAFDGKVTRAASELDPSTRTMNTEIRVPNPDGALLAGMYAEVQMTLPLPHRVLEIPASALMNDARGARVAVVDDQSRIHLQPVVVERDNGATIDVASGLTGKERIARIGSAAFVEGMQVEVAQ
jgi:membrane fusion protein (multidrug efflux system)